MAISFRRDLQRSPADFVEAHRGLRNGCAFGVPAAFSGRRMFACVIDDGIACRLPADGIRRALQSGARPFAPVLGPAGRRGRAMAGWVFYRPPRDVFSRQIARVLEESARFAAELSLAGGRTHERMTSLSGAARTQPPRRQRIRRTTSNPSTPASRKQR